MVGDFANCNATLVPFQTEALPNGGTISDMFRRFSIALLAVTVSAPLSAAQMRGGMGRTGFAPHTRSARGVRSGFGPHHERAFTRGILLNSPFLYSDYYSGYDYSDNASNYDSGETDGVDGAQPRILVVRPAAADDSPRRAKPGPLLIEWQGDRYVRFGGAEETGQRGSSTQRDYAEPALTKSLTKPSAASAPKEPAESQARELPPAVLVYRDGHREEISDYAIANGMIYIHGDYWQDGSGTKHIPLSSLDPPATMQANQQRGVKFMLPSASNVVIASF